MGKNKPENRVVTTNIFIVTIFISSPIDSAIERYGCFKILNIIVARIKTNVRGSSIKRILFDLY